MKNGSDSDDLSPPEELLQLEGFAGDGRDLHTAIANAWENGKRSGDRIFRSRRSTSGEKIRSAGTA